MATFDYARDVIDLFFEHSSDYILVLLQPQKKGDDKSLVFYNVNTKKNAKQLSDTLQYVSKNVLDKKAGKSKGNSLEREKRRRK